MEIPRDNWKSLIYFLICHNICQFRSSIGKDQRFDMICLHKAKIGVKIRACREMQEASYPTQVRITIEPCSSQKDSLIEVDPKKEICILKSNNIALQLLPQRLQTSHAKSRLVHSGCIFICQPHSRSLHAAASCPNLFIFQDVDIYIYLLII